MEKGDWEEFVLLMEFDTLADLMYTVCVHMASCILTNHRVILEFLLYLIYLEGRQPLQGLCLTT